jgi:hypothetical protein
VALYVPNLLPPIVEAAKYSFISAISDEMLADVHELQENLRKGLEDHMIRQGITETQNFLHDTWTKVLNEHPKDEVENPYVRLTASQLASAIDAIDSAMRLLKAAEENRDGYKSDYDAVLKDVAKVARKNKVLRRKVRKLRGLLGI